MDQNIDNTEIWKTIFFAKKYECSNLGNVREIETKQLISPILTKDTYLCVVLRSNNNKECTQPIHRIIATTFLENPENKKWIKHINGNYKDNKVINLVWTTNIDNILKIKRNRKIIRAKIKDEKLAKFNEAETWKVISFACNYECSDLGNIKSTRTQRLLSFKKDGHGYLRISLITNDKQKNTYGVHRIVAITFLENPENKKTVDHINRIRDDNRLINLKWATHNEQCENKKINKTNINKRKKIWQCDLKTKEKMTLFDSANDAAIYLKLSKQSKHNINQCANVDALSPLKWGDSFLVYFNLN